MKLKLFYETHKNKLKIGFTIAITLVITLLPIIIYHITNYKKNMIYHTSTKTTISSSDKKFNISYDNNYNLSSKTSDTYVLVLENKENFLIRTTKIPKDFNFTLEKFLSSDKISFLNSLGNYKETSEIISKTYTNISGVSYKITYTYKSIDYIITEFLTEVDGNLYFFDISYPKSLQNKYEPVAEELLNSITLNNNE